jgi:hypothetical protein
VIANFTDVSSLCCCMYFCILATCGQCIRRTSHSMWSCCHIPLLGGCDKRGVCMQLSEEKNWGPLIHKGRLYFVTNTVPMEIVRADPSDGSCVVVFKESITNRNSLYTRYGMPIRGGSQFVRFNDTHWMAIVHQRKDYPYGPVYTHRTMMLSFGEHDTEVPTQYSLSEPYRYACFLPSSLRTAASNLTC